VTTKNATSAAESTLAVRTLEIYRTQLADLLFRTESVGQNGDAEIQLAVGALVDQLSVDLIRLYDDLVRGALAQSDRVSALPTLEFMREVLRHRWSRPRPLRDTLRKALASH
jgi:hypothetical protein